MIPASFMTLPALPLTPNGKLDRRALPMPAPAGSPREGPIVAPRTGVEEVLSEVWRQVLKRDQISIHDNFFHLGGHSLLAMQLIARVHEAFQVTVPLQQFFEAPTIVGLAVAVTQGQAEQLAAEAVAGLLAEVEGLSPEDIQARLANDQVQE
jgi:acyl carrier protein